MYGSRKTLLPHTARSSMAAIWVLFPNLVILSWVMYPGLPAHLIFQFVIFICEAILKDIYTKKIMHAGRTECHSNKPSQRRYTGKSESKFLKTASNSYFLLALLLSKWLYFYFKKQFFNQKSMEYFVFQTSHFPWTTRYMKKKLILTSLEVWAVF